VSALIYRGFQHRFCCRAVTQIHKQLGNSVSVPVVNAIAKEIIKCLENIA
jgi:site-specific DNA-cytosine methylase